MTEGRADVCHSASSWFPWIALALGFSPVLADLARNFAFFPQGRASAVAALLLVWSALGSRELPRRGRGDGVIPLLGAVALEVIGIATNSRSIARLGLAFGIVGLARMRGFPSLGVAALAFFAIPLPHFVVSSLSPHLESSLASLASWIATGTGLEVNAVGPGLQAPTGRVDLIPGDGGLVLGQLLAAIGWFAGLRRAASLGGLVTRAAAWSMMALPIQALGVVVATIVAGIGLPNLGTWWLRYGLWPVLSIVGVLIAWRAEGTPPTRRPSRRR